jgi:hypothetical protein
MRCGLQTTRCEVLRREGRVYIKKVFALAAVKVVSGKCVVVSDASRGPLANGEAGFVGKIHHEVTSVKGACEKMAAVGVF